MPIAPLFQNQKKTRIPGRRGQECMSVSEAASREAGKDVGPQPPARGAIKMGPAGKQSLLSTPAPMGGSCLLLLFCLRLGTSCPQSCQCPDRDGAVAVHCSASGLQEIPRDIPANTVLLKLDANKIARVPNGAFQHLSQLRELDLSQNAIETIGPAAFSGLAGGLRLLDLSHNRIRRIPKDALGKLSAKIRLSHNPLHCECDLQEALWELTLSQHNPGTFSYQTYRNYFKNDLENKSKFYLSRESMGSYSPKSILCFCESSLYM